MVAGSQEVSMPSAPGERDLPVGYFEVELPPGDAVCSDNACPCPEVPIPRGTGYIYID